MEGARHLSWAKKGGLCATVGLLLAFVFLALDRSYSLATIIGVRPLLMATALGSVAALGLVAAFARKESRAPTLATPVPILLRLLAWWCAMALALLLVAFASWRQWGIVFLFASIAVMIKALSVYTYVKHTYQFRIWEPFAVILGFVLFIGAILLFLTRADVPPPVVAALGRYYDSPTAPDPASRPALDLSGAGYSVHFEGDMDLGGLPVSFLSYASKDGSRVDVYIAKIRFPSPLGSAGETDPPGWSVTLNHLYLRAGNAPAHFLVVGDSQDAVNAVAHAYFSSRTVVVS